MTSVHHGWPHCEARKRGKVFLMFQYLRFSSISRFSAECDRLVPPVPKTRLTFVRTSSRAVSVNLFVIRIFQRWEKRKVCFFGTEKEMNDQITTTNSKCFFFHQEVRERERKLFQLITNAKGNKQDPEGTIFMIKYVIFPQSPQTTLVS